MKVEIDLKKSIEKNASDYFEKSKKSKKKLERMEVAINGVERKIKNAKKSHSKITIKKTISKKRTREWYEKFHWFFTSDGFLVIGGRDARSNELVVKKHMDKNDVYFHAEIYGAPHCTLKSQGKKVPETSLQEAAQFAGIFSSAWKRGFPSIDVYSVKPEQVSKKAPAGEALGTGAFMIYGKRTWYRKTPLSFAIGIKEEKDSETLISGPASSVKENANVFVGLEQGRLKKGDAAKKVREIFEKKLSRKLSVSMDDFLQMLPAGEFDLTQK